jgi:large subunit ribosomal protein L24
MRKLKTEDEIVVTAGRDKGKRGRILRVLTDERLYVSGVNMVKRHTKPNPNLNRPGGIIEKEAPIHISNVAIVNRKTDRADRVGFKVLDDGARVRIYKSTGDEIDA